MVDIAAAPLAFATRLGADRVVDLSADAEGLTKIPRPRRGDRGRRRAPRRSKAPSAPSAAAARSCSSAACPAADFPAPVNPVMAKELDLVGSFRFDSEFEEAVDAHLPRARSTSSPSSPRRRPLADVNDAFALALDRSQSVKVVLTAE